MAKTRKIKKKALLGLIAILLIVLVVVIVVLVRKPKDPETPVDEGNPVYELPETEYSNMEVKNVEMEYLKDNNQTMITMEFNNITQNRIENENIEVLWINADGVVIGRMPTHIPELDPGKQYSISVIQKGDLTATAQIKLEKR